MVASIQAHNRFSSVYTNNSVSPCALLSNLHIARRGEHRRPFSSLNSRVMLRKRSSSRANLDEDSATKRRTSLSGTPLMTSTSLSRRNSIAEVATRRSTRPKVSRSNSLCVTANNSTRRTRVGRRRSNATTPSTTPLCTPQSTPNTSSPLVNNDSGVCLREDYTDVGFLTSFIIFI